MQQDASSATFKAYYYSEAEINQCFDFAASREKGSG